MKVLHLEDNPADAELVRRLLRQRWAECDIHVCQTEAEFRAALDRGGLDLILSDFQLGSMSGSEALRMSRELAPAAPFLFLSGTIGEDRAIESVHAGAADYVLKDNLRRLVPAVERALSEHRERRQRLDAEQQVRALNHMIDQAQDAIVIVDLDGPIRYWSAGAERLFGWSRQSVLGKTAAEIFLPDLLPALQAANDATLAHGAWQGQLPLNNREGEIRVIDMRRTLVREENGRPKAHLSISTDVTQKRQMEEHLQRVKRLENVGRIAAAVAHDLNNILAPITLGVPLLRESVTDATGANLLGMLEQSASRATEMVKNMLTFVSQGPATEATFVPLLIGEIARVIRQTFPETIQLLIESAPELPAVAINPTQLHQVLMNLCVNARDAMPGGGRLTLRSRRRTVTDHASAAKVQPGDYVEVEVEDTGTGIPEHVLARMWEAFYSTKEKHRGTGLGLATVKGIIQSHGGGVEVKTVVGQGTTFRLLLPAAKPEAETPAANVANVPPSGQGEVLLFVDDESAVRLVVSTLLTEAGYQVLLAANGSQALDLYAQRGRDISLVITDNLMPGIDGPRLARLLHNMDPSLPIVAVTAAQGGAAAVFDPGTYQGSVSKPYQARQLLETVARTLPRRAGGRAAP